MLGRTSKPEPDFHGSSAGSRAALGKIVADLRRMLLDRPLGSLTLPIGSKPPGNQPFVPHNRFP